MIVTVSGVQGLQKALSRLKRIDGIVYNWMRSGETDQVMNTSFGRNFNQQGRPKWDALTERTKEDRKNKGFANGPILFRTGNLRDEVTNLKGIVVRAGNMSEVSWGVDGIRQSSREKYEVNQGGSKHVPARPMVVFQDEDGPKLLRSFAEFLGKQLV